MQLTPRRLPQAQHKSTGPRLHKAEGPSIEYNTVLCHGRLGTFVTRTASDPAPRSSRANHPRHPSCQSAAQGIEMLGGLFWPLRFASF